MDLQYAWLAEYSDGKSLPQFDGTRENLYSDIDRQRLVRFHLMDRANNTPRVTLHIRNGIRLIVRRRTMMPNGKPSFVVWLVGWQKTIGGVNFQVVNLVFPDGRIETIDKFEGDHILYGQINLMDAEKHDA